MSVLALAIPLAATSLRPNLFEGPGILLVVLPALLPAFLLSYHKGWSGASLALAAGMATLALTHAEILMLHVPVPRWDVLLGATTVLLAVSLGSGWITELLIREREKAEEWALTDPLTGMPNRRHAMAFLEGAWGTGQRGRDISVVLFDLDLFKQVNDEHGRMEGDRVIVAFANLLADRARRMDISARLGGEEFISVLVDCGPEQAFLFAEELRGRLADLDFGWGKVTVSAGVASMEEGMNTPDVLIADADRALSEAKEGGRNRTCTATTPQRRPSRHPPSPSSAPGPKPDALIGLRVLLVDDDEDTLRVAAELLTRLGCVPSTASSVKAAVEVLKDDPTVQLLVTDIVMPEMSGFTLVDLANKVRTDLPVLYVSGYPQEEVYWGGTPGARSAFLGKPIEFEALRAALLQLVDDGDGEGAGADQREDGVAGAAGPAAPSPGGGHAPEVHRPPPPTQGRILIVDDDQAVVRSLTRLFTRAGYERPDGLTNPHEAVGRLESGNYDLLILDLHMPDLDGFQVLASLMPIFEPGEYFPVLVLTGDDDPMIRRHALAAGAMDFLNKPFDPAEAEARVANLLRTRFLNQRVSRQRDAMESQVLARTAELADTRSEILHRLARAAEYRDDVTGRHAARVGLLASRLASELGMQAMEVDLIRRTAPLHDVGKIGVPDEVLLKPGSLSEEEYQLIKRHTVIGAEILGGSHHKILVLAREIALSHHERWEGGGYPHDLLGEDIPIAARIVAVADTFDVISHRRSYKDPLPPAVALQEIVRCSGSHFDPGVVEAFRAICDRVGIDQLHLIADPIDPWRDTTGPERPN